jgi:hypothetical protein
MKQIKSKSNFFRLITLILVITVLFIGFYFSLEKNLSLENLHGNPPRVLVHNEYIELNGAVEINSLYVTRATAEIVDRTLYISLKGLLIPVSRLEGEYHFELNVNKNDYDVIKFVGSENDKHVLIK